MKRQYRSGSRWAFWRWTQLQFRGIPYMDRLHLIKTPWFSVMLHFFHGGPDPHQNPHDHPVTFASFVLRGWYRERRYIPGVHVSSLPLGFHLIRWFNFKRPTDIHRIVAAKPGTVTLVVAGPVVREWGFYTMSGWKSWKNYGAGK